VASLDFIEVGEEGERDEIKRGQTSERKGRTTNVTASWEGRKNARLGLAGIVTRVPANCINKA